MNFLKNLFGGGENKNTERDGRALFVYVQPHRCDDIIRVRVDLNNDLSLNDENSGYWVRKMASSSNYKCAHVELTLHFDQNRRLRETDIQGGRLATHEDYEAWTQQQV